MCRIIKSIDLAHFFLGPILLVFLFPLPGFAQKPVPVIVSKVEVDTFYDRVEALGTLKANESVVITAPVTDTITRLNFDDGQRVDAGYILAEMTNDEEHALIEEEVFNLKEAEKQLKRIEQLVKQGASSQAQLDQQSRNYQTAKARIRQIESRLQDRLILAPFAGIVGLRNISTGALVEPGDVITTLDDDSIMKLDFSVPETYLGSITPGLKITARPASYDTLVFNGTVSSIDSRVDVMSRSIIARAILDNPDRKLLPGMLMSIELLKNPRKALVIPEEAIIPLAESFFVYVVDEKVSPVKVVKQKVIPGSRRVGEIEILSGVSPEDLVVVHGAVRLRPDSVVEVIAVDDGTRSLSEMLNQKKK